MRICLQFIALQFPHVGQMCTLRSGWSFSQPAGTELAYDGKSPHRLVPRCLQLMIHTCSIKTAGRKALMRRPLTWHTRGFSLCIFHRNGFIMNADHSRDLLYVF